MMDESATIRCRNCHSNDVSHQNNPMFTEACFEKLKTHSKGFSAGATIAEWLALSHFVDYGIEANVLPFMTGFTLIWFNSRQLWAPSHCLLFSGHLDRFGPDNAQLLEIFFLTYLISKAWGVLYQKRLFPRNRFLWRIMQLWVTHLLAYRIHMQQENTAHFEICNRLQFRLTLFPDWLPGTRLWRPRVEIIHSHLVSDGHFVMATAACPDAAGGHVPQRRMLKDSTFRGLEEMDRSSKTSNGFISEHVCFQTVVLFYRCCVRQRHKKQVFFNRSGLEVPPRLCALGKLNSVLLETFFTNKFMDSSGCRVSPNPSLQNVAY